MTLPASAILAKGQLKRSASAQQICLILLTLLKRKTNKQKKPNEHNGSFYFKSVFSFLVQKFNEINEIQGQIWEKRDVFSSLH